MLWAKADPRQGLFYRWTKTQKEWKPLAEGGDPFAQYNLGVMYNNGWGVLQDYKTAVKLYRLAAEQGSAFAQSSLGVMYYNGRGVSQDNTIAHMWFNIEATDGDKLAGNKRDVIAKKMTPAAIKKPKLWRENVRAAAIRNVGISLSQ